MDHAVKRFFNTFKSKSVKDKHLISAIKNIIGRRPANINLYYLALKHSSTASQNQHGLKESNERLEYLGDAILGAVIADFLFKKFPLKDEGFLTRIRSRLVNRESLNTLGRKIGLIQLVEYNKANKIGKLTHKSLYGNTLEALVGAVYLDHGYRFCQHFILDKLILPYFDIREVVNSDPNYKSRVIEWAQKKNKAVRFEIIDIKQQNNHKEFTAQVFIDDKAIGTGHGYSKKKAEQNASMKTCGILEI